MKSISLNRCVNSKFVDEILFESFEILILSFEKNALEMLNVSTNSTSKEQLEQLCSTTIDNSQDFTDSVYISNEQREKLLEFHRKLQDQLAEIIKLISNQHEVRLDQRNVNSIMLKLFPH